MLLSYSPTLCKPQQASDKHMLKLDERQQLQTDQLKEGGRAPGTDLEGNHGAGWEVISAAGGLVETSGLADGANQTIGEEDAHAVRVS